MLYIYKRCAVAAAATHIFTSCCIYFALLSSSSHHIYDTQHKLIPIISLLFSFLFLPLKQHNAHEKMRVYIAYLLAYFFFQYYKTMVYIIFIYIYIGLNIVESKRYDSCDWERGYDDDDDVEWREEKKKKKMFIIIININIIIIFISLISSHI